ncbi:MAG: glycosyltransferase family 39 protein [bacterium]
MPKIDKKVLILITIIAITAFLRLWKLNAVPPGLYPDVAINGNDALFSLQNKNFKVFYPENNGREGFFIWAIAFAFALLGPSVLAIKITTAFFGILTVYGTYLLAKELFKESQNISNETLGLLSAFFLAFSFCHINFSRIGFRAITVPFILVFCFYFLLRGFKEKNYLFTIIAGSLFGLGFYTYIGFRTAVLILCFALFVFWIIEKKRFSTKFLSFAALLFVSITIVSLPIVIHFINHSNDFSSRAMGISIFTNENPFRALVTSSIAHLAMFGIYGDPNWRHNLPTTPLLSPGLAILFIISIVFSIKKIISSHKNGLLSDTGALFSFPYIFLLIWIFAMILPGVLTIEGIPHFLRTIGVIPAVYILTAVGAIKSYHWLYENSPRKKLFIGVCAFFLVAVAINPINQYFILWGKSAEVNDAFSVGLTKIGAYLNSLPDNINSYVITNISGVPVPFPDGLSVAAQTPLFIENSMFGKPRAVYLSPDKIEMIITAGKTVIIPLAYQESLFQELKERFPSGQIQEENGIFVYKINY